LSIDGQHAGKVPESALVALSQRGDRAAFAEIVRRRQAWIRNLMRRLSGDVVLADDLSQQVFFQAWKTVHHVQHRARFAPWLKQVAVNTWLQHVRRNDPLRSAVEYEDAGTDSGKRTDIGMDLDQALATLPNHVRLCIVLSYYERMTHSEIGDFTGLPLGTIKSHIRRGTKQLRELLSAYDDAHKTREPT
jgi:RNA polymerase sigma-70 factor (ECF subfamily)